MIEIEQYLSQIREGLPKWLNDNNYHTKPSFETLLKSRVIYYPGAGIDGQPIKTFNKSHFAHVFFYVDYGKSREGIVKELSEPEAFKGYKLVELFNYEERELANRGWVRHYQLVGDELRYFNDISRNIPTPYCVLGIFEREDGYDENHGAKRFAVLYLCGDAIFSYDAIFANRGISPIMIILQDHGFGNNYNWFGNEGALHQIVRSTNTFPMYALIADNTAPWEEYDKVEDVAHVLGSGHLRWLYRCYCN